MNEEQNSMERRMVLRVLQHWRDAAAERDMPAHSDLDPEAMADVWNECFILDVSRPDDPIFGGVGSAFRDLCGEDFSGRALSAVPENTLVGAAASYHNRVLSKKVPLSVGGQVAQNNGQQLLYRSTLLPLSDDGNAINSLLGAANCRILTED